jgi:hypothetical protein
VRAPANRPAANRLLTKAMIPLAWFGKKGEFFNDRVSPIAQRRKTLAHLRAVLKVMSDKSVETGA